MKRYYPRQKSGEMGNERPPCTATSKQEAFLTRHQLQTDGETGFYDAMFTIRDYVHTRRQLPPTDKQIRLLKEHGKWHPGMSRGEAFDTLRRLFAGPPKPPRP